ncbi:hypothetical protein N182_10615 [Sinorhizobium sp. GL2]|nr:hypothetical protein N182_10615 [Sinorhizobium sp. GL2]
MLAAYLFLSPIYAIVHFSEYASSTLLLIRYVLVPAALAVVFLAVGFFARPQLAMAAGIYGLSALVGFFLFETLLTLRSVPVRLSMLGQLSHEQSVAIARERDFVGGFTLAQLNRLSGVRDLRNAVLSGFPASQVILCAQPDRVISYRADRFGFNNPDAIYEDGRMDAMLLGDSFVEGFCLPPGEDLVSRLRRNDVLAASAGIRGSGPLTQLAMLGRYGPMFKPHRVFMVFFEGNDWKNLEGELKFPWLRTALEKDADFGTPLTAGEATLRARDAMREFNSRPVGVADLFTRTDVPRNFIALQQTFTLLGLNYPKATRDIPEFGRILQQAKSIAHSWGGSFELVYVPRVDRFMGVVSPRSAYEPLRKRVVEAAASAGVPVIDLLIAFEGRPRPLELYGADGHFSNSGAAFAAEIIARRLQGGSIADAAVRQGR